MNKFDYGTLQLTFLKFLRLFSTFQLLNGYGQIHMAKEKNINCSVKCRLKKKKNRKNKSNFVHENEIRTPPATNGL